MIRIVYRTGEEDLVAPKFLDILLYLGQVQMFERSDGWAVVGVDSLRGSSPAPPACSERRQHLPTPLPSPVSPAFWTRHNWCH